MQPSSPSAAFGDLGKRQRSHRRKLTNEESEEIRYAFDKLSGGGTAVSARQLKLALRAMGFPVKKADVELLLRDKGFAEGAQIDQSSFYELLGSKMVERTPGEELKRAFGLFDLHGSGKITVQDLSAIARQLQCDIDPGEIQVRVLGSSPARCGGGKGVDCVRAMRAECVHGCMHGCACGRGWLAALHERA